MITLVSDSDRKRRDQVNEATKRWRAANPERSRELARARHAASPERSRAANKKWRLENLEYSKQQNKNATYKRKFGITLEDYNVMFAAQEGRCDICTTHQSDLKRSLAVDHNHETGKVRSLLCSNCNIALGNFRDSDVVLERALQYLRRHS